MLPLSSPSKCDTSHLVNHPNPLQLLKCTSVYLVATRDRYLSARRSISPKSGYAPLEHYIPPLHIQLQVVSSNFTLSSSSPFLKSWNTIEEFGRLRFHVFCLFICDFGSLLHFHPCLHLFVCNFSSNLTLSLALQIAHSHHCPSSTTASLAKSPR